MLDIIITMSSFDSDSVLGILGVIFLLVFLVPGVVGLMCEIPGILPHTITEEVHLNTEIASSNTTRLENVPAHSYRLICKINAFGYQYTVLNQLINHTGGLHGPNYVNITIRNESTILFSKVISEIPTSQVLTEKIILKQKSNITVDTFFTIRDHPDNDDFEFNATWEITFKEDDFVKEIAEVFNYDWEMRLGVVVLIIVILFILSRFF